MPTFEDADHNAHDLLAELIAGHRDDLVRAEAEITLLFAFGDFENGHLKSPALKIRGKRALGKCKVNGLADRADGKKDATITLDGDAWPGLSARRKLALLHHELLHIDVWSGDRDSDARPKLKARHGDWDFDGFHEVLATYGEESLEHANLSTVAEHHRQLKLPFATEAKPAKKPTKTKSAPRPRA